MYGHAHCVQFLRKYNVPLILLGGGGYTVKNVARTWTYETACALGIEAEIDPNLPWNQYFEWFGPRYRLEVVDNNMDDLNIKEGSLDVVRSVLLVSLSISCLTFMYRATALEQLQQLACAPSVPMQDVPRETLGQHLGFGRDEEEGRDELDEQLARQYLLCRT
jgi:histone deacetylase 1/2